MGRERLTWTVLVATLLTIGLLIGRQFMLYTEDTQVDESAKSFRESFWQSRVLDLVAQVGLIFAGALGIAALLPREKESDDT